eukprot:TRINITY_DN3422_c0_g1_i2.p1 TRINITY_DN3422_c0_g1~~TRINITY_DN3422_c0_g1_i2.p1  ORF type:complete len:346 (+),score=87.26 TRINITY_DN3422_c0_g1_i2:54-1040(+)
MSSLDNSAESLKDIERMIDSQHQAVNATRARTPSIDPIRADASTAVRIVGFQVGSPGTPGSLPKTPVIPQPKQQQPQQPQQQSKPSQGGAQAKPPKQPKQQQQKQQQQQQAKQPQQARQQARQAQAATSAAPTSTGPAPTHQNSLGLFAHLPVWSAGTAEQLQISFGPSDVHPDMLAVGLKMAQGAITGSEARCTAMLLAFKNMISDIRTPPERTFHYEFGALLKPAIVFLKACRPLCTSMGNAIKYLKAEFQTCMKLEYSEEKTKAHMLEKIDSYIDERIVAAGKVIVNVAQGFIQDNDVVLIYARYGSQQKQHHLRFVFCWLVDKV